MESTETDENRQTDGERSAFFLFFLDSRIEINRYFEYNTYISVLNVIREK